MTLRARILRVVVVFGCLLVIAAAIYIACQRALSLPFRSTNDMLHRQEAPMTLDFLIPAGIHIDEKMTTGQVAILRFQKPKNRLTHIVDKLSSMLPVKYRLLGTVTVYLFWSFLFLVFFRLFTWMRYVKAMAMSFLCGAVVYFFMPDLIMGRLDDTAFLVWAVGFLGALRWHSKLKRLKPS
jgi:hypothetical protein